MSSTFDDASLVFIPSGYKTSKAYSVKPSDGSGDLTFSRSNDTATRVNSAGLIEKVRTNLNLYSQDFTNAAYVTGGFGSLASVAANTTANPLNGAQDADTATFTAGGTQSRLLQQFSGLSTTNKYTYSIYVKAGTKNSIKIYGDVSVTGVVAEFNLSTGSVVGTPTLCTASIVSAGSGWYRCSITFNAQGAGSADCGPVSWAGEDGTAFIYGAQLEVSDFGATPYIASTAAVSVGPVANVPRLDYLNSSCPRLLLEPQRSNLVTFSEQFDNAAWVGGNVTVTANNVTSPDGYTNADTFTEDASTAQHGRASALISFVSGTTYTFSAFAKNAPSGRGFVQLYGYQLGSGTANVFANFDLNTGVVGTATGGTSTITNYGNGWYRCTFTFACGNTLNERINLVNVTSASATAGQSYAGDITKSIYWWGAQVEAGAYATSYIPTLGSASTRSWDDASKTGITSLIGQTAGTLFVELNADGRTNSVARPIAYLTADGTTANRVAIQYNTNGQIQAIASSGGSTQGSVVYTITGPCKAAFAYNASGYELFVNGVSRGTFSGSLPSSLTRLDLNSLSGTFDELGGTISQVLIFPTRLSNSDLAALTA